MKERSLEVFYDRSRQWQFLLFRTLSHLAMSPLAVIQYLVEDGMRGRVLRPDDYGDAHLSLLRLRSIVDQVGVLALVGDGALGASPAEVSDLQSDLADCLAHSFSLGDVSTFHHDVPFVVDIDRNTLEAVCALLYSFVEIILVKDCTECRIEFASESLGRDLFVNCNKGAIDQRMSSYGRLLINTGVGDVKSLQATVPESSLREATPKNLEAMGELPRLSMILLCQLCEASGVRVMCGKDAVCYTVRLEF